MAQDAPSDVAKSKPGPWKTWGIIAGATVLLGLLVPQILPRDSVPIDASPKAERKSEGNLAYSAPSLPDAPSAQDMLVRLGLVTAIVLCLCVGTLWGARRWLHAASPAGAAPREMRLTETLQLGGRCAIHLVHLGKQPILIGVDASGIKTVVPLASPFADVLVDVEQAPDAVIPTVPDQRAA